MGCSSSKHIKKHSNKDFNKKDLKKQSVNGRSNYTHHVVFLISSTYGALKVLDKDQPAPENKNSPPEVINTWELMEDLDDEAQVPEQVPAKTSPSIRGGFTPMKMLNQMGSSPKRFFGKEKKAATLSPDFRISKRVPGFDSARRKNLGISKRKFQEKVDIKKVISLTPKSRESSARQKNLGISKRKFQEKEEIKKVISLTPKSRKSIDSMCENTVVIYTTTLRGIQKTFEDCNIVRGIIESHNVRMNERDVSMDLGFKEELRKLLGKKEVKLPVVLVKGRLITGSEEITKLEEEGKVEILLEGIPAMTDGCKRCGGIRFTICTVCNRSCKLIGVDGSRSVKCIECNENGLVKCSLCL